VSRDSRDTRPNLLVIMSDDQGPWALACAGNPDIRTPTLDRLAAEGTRFDNFFCASPVCSPARASFLTGRVPSQHGVHDWLRSGNIEVEEGVTWHGRDRPIEYLEGLDGFTDVLARAGYECALSGKWHMGASGLPQKGHTYWHAHSLGGGQYYDYHVFENSTALVHKEQYVTDYFTDRAIEFIKGRERGAAPFCLSVHYTAPHAPWDRANHPAELFDSYMQCKFESMPAEPPHPWRGWDPSPQKRRKTIAGYFAAVTAMDSGIARILAALDELGLRENTLIVFLSDNGFNVGHHGICGKGNGTFPLNMYEESVKVPLIVSHPGNVPPGAVSSGLCSQYDFMPTILEYLGLENPEAERLPGRSFAAALRGEPDAGGEEVVVFDEYGPVRMIRDREWKYVHRFPYGPHELYHLAADPGERTNLVEDEGHADVVARMRGRLDEWFLEYVDPARDGARQPVTSKDQIDLVGPPGGGRTAFV
jgi:choline-sulfatase